MKHDVKLVKAAADKDLLALGQDKIVYFSKLDAAKISNMVLPPELIAEAKNLWGVYSASGDVLAVCDSIIAASQFVDDQHLVAVTTH